MVFSQKEKTQLRAEEAVLQMKDKVVEEPRTPIMTQRRSLSETEKCGHTYTDEQIGTNHPSSISQFGRVLESVTAMFQLSPILAVHHLSSNYRIVRQQTLLYIGILIVFHCL